MISRSISHFQQLLITLFLRLLAYQQVFLPFSNYESPNLLRLAYQQVFNDNPFSNY